MTDAIARSIVAAIELAGVDHVALGSDFDGAVRTPFDATGMPLLTEALLAEGLSDDDIGAVMGGNAVRLLLAAAQRWPRAELQGDHVDRPYLPPWLTGQVTTSGRCMRVRAGAVVDLSLRIGSIIVLIVWTPRSRSSAPTRASSPRQPA